MLGYQFMFLVLMKTAFWVRASGAIWILTNNHWGYGTLGEDYVHLAQGRDYSDVSPIRGVIHGGADHTLDVAVTVMPK